MTLVAPRLLIDEQNVQPSNQQKDEKSVLGTLELLELLLFWHFADLTDVSEILQRYKKVFTAAQQSNSSELKL